MSGLVKLAKKVFKPIRNVVKKVLKSKVFKVIAIAAAVVFTGGMALGAVGAAGSGILGTLSAGFQAGLSALGQVGSAIWTGVKAAGTAVKGFFTGAGGTGAAVGTGGAPVVTSVPTVVGNTAAQGVTAAATHGAGTTVAGTVAKGMTNAALINTGGQMLSGYAQGKAQDEMVKEQERLRLSRDQYGVDGYGNNNGLNDANAEMRKMFSLDAPSVSTPDAPSVAPVSAPKVNRVNSPVSTTMRDRLIASLDAPNVAYNGAV